jgi:signal transduction histidine kinase
MLRLVEFSAGTNFAVDSWFLRAPAGKLGAIPVGKMALFTAIAFLGASLGLAILAWSRRPSSQELWNIAGAGATVTGAIGLVFALGYLFSPDDPLLYGSEAIPMALNTAVAFVLLGTGLAAAAGPDSFPLHRVCGTSISTRLLRVFLPLVVGTVVTVAWLTHVVSMTSGGSSAAISSAALATAAIFVFGFSLERIAGRVGQRIEQAEAALQQANDELELKLLERTRSLQQANEDQAGAFRDLNVAHRDLNVAHVALQKSHEDLKQTQGRMLQQAKLASLGRTAAGVAHEINNPLAFVTNNITMLKREVTDLHDILRLYQQAETTLAAYQRDLLERIRVAERRGGSAVRPGQSGRSAGPISGGPQADPEDRREPPRLRPPGRSRIEGGRPERGSHRDGQHSPRTGRPKTCHPGDGAAARPETELLSGQDQHGRPEPGAQCYRCLFGRRQGRRQSCGRTRARAEAVEIEVVDDGCGIDPAIQGKVFDPFFTTKPVGQGTGLGLSMSYGIIKDHGGSIDFESEPGRGTRFTLVVPFSPIPRFASSGDSRAQNTRPAPTQA